MKKLLETPGPVANDELTRRTFLKIATMLMGAGLPVASWTVGCGPSDGSLGTGDSVEPPEGTSTGAADAAADAHATDLPPDAGSLHPDAATIHPDASSIPPDASTIPADASTIRPDAATLPPDAGFQCTTNLCLDLTARENSSLRNVGGAVVVPNAPNGDRIIVARTGTNSVAALSAVCTHAGCDVSYRSAQRDLNCPCHGSRFGLDGHVIAGPAFRPLTVYTATLSAGANWITLSV